VGIIIKTLFILLLLSNLATGQIESMTDSAELDSTIIYTEVYDEVEEWVYENKGTVITRELKRIRYILFDIYITAYYPKNFLLLAVKIDARIREGTFNALTIHFNKGYGIGHGVGKTEGYKEGWQESKDDSGAKALYAVIAGVVIGGFVMYGIVKIGSQR
jgi:hypothetical protein